MRAFDLCLAAFPLALAAVRRERAEPGSEPFLDPAFDPELRERLRHDHNRSDLTEALWRLRRSGTGR